MTPHRWQIAFLQDDPMQPKERAMVDDGEARDGEAALARVFRRVREMARKSNIRCQNTAKRVRNGQ